MEVERRKLIYGNKKAMNINGSSLFFLYSWCGSDGRGTLVGCGRVTGRLTFYPRILPQRMAA
jgi:hypothetical protein